MRAEDLGGLTPGAACVALAGMLQRGPPGWLIVPTAAEIGPAVRGLRFHLQEAGLPIPVLPCPEDDTSMGVSPDPERPLQRVLARASVSKRQTGQREGRICQAMVVASAAALCRLAPPLERRVLRPGAQLDRAALTGWLLAWGWLQSPELEAPGTFRRAGDVWWFWPPDRAAPVQVDCFDDEIEQIRAGNEGKPGRPLASLRLLPMREVCLSPERAEAAVGWLHRRYSDRHDRRGGQGPDRRQLIQDLRDGLPFAGMELLLPALGALEPVGAALSGLPVFLYEPERCVAEAEAVLPRARQRYEGLPLRERPWTEPEDLWLPSPVLPPARRLYRLRLPGIADAQSRPAHLRIGADPEALVKELRQRLEEGERITLVAESAGRGERIRELFAGHGLELGERLVTGDLPEGFSMDGRLLLTAHELFGDRLRDAGSAGGAGSAGNVRRLQRGAAGFSKLRRGEAVVHNRHGVGLFRGLVRMAAGGAQGEREGGAQGGVQSAQDDVQDYVQIEYRDGERLYLPAWRLDQLSLWRPPLNADGTPGEAKPALDRLGGSSFGVRKAKVRDELLALAHRLLAQAAERRAHAIPAFPPPGPLYAQFAAAFPWAETPDQTQAIEEILADLEQPRPMDRLLVGDVGFGKTEVALRAVFRAVEEGRQAVVLCPSTLLCWQHTQRFTERLADFPVRIASLSRLATGAAAQQILADVKAGRVDLLIGTHRLLTAGLRFKDLGLVVIDEEHRFGVRQKEQARRLARDAHCLSLSATPIPRSLHLALSGLSSLSLLQTPPPGRLQIRTDVLPFSPARIADDLRAEFQRGGQVFFVHNRVQSIHATAEWLQRLVPEARIGVAHGQLSEAALERVMERLLAQEINVLVCTTLIESGIDLPRVNTMIINRAEQFGLAQLYQLRGRVGRGDLPARCTLLLSEAGRERRAALARMSALQEAEAIGSGIGLAQRDLELRGSGDLLGERQHGAIAAIGLDAYVELLEEAVTRARGQADLHGARPRIDPELELPVPAFLPEDLLPDTGERLELYRWLADARTPGELHDLEARLARRAGLPLPAPIQNLLQCAFLRLQMRGLLIPAMSLQRLRLAVTVHPDSPLPTEALIGLCSPGRSGRFRISPDGRLIVALTPQEAEAPIQAAAAILSRMQGLIPG